MYESEEDDERPPVNLIISAPTAFVDHGFNSPNFFPSDLTIKGEGFMEKGTMETLSNWMFEDKNSNYRWQYIPDTNVIDMRTQDLLVKSITSLNTTAPYANSNTRFGGAAPVIGGGTVNQPIYLGDFLTAVEFEFDGPRTSIIYVANPIFQNQIFKVDFSAIISIDVNPYFPIVGFDVGINGTPIGQGMITFTIDELITTYAFSCIISISPDDRINILVTNTNEEGDPTPNNIYILTQSISITRI